MSGLNMSLNKNLQRKGFVYKSFAHMSLMSWLRRRYETVVSKSRRAVFNRLLEPDVSGVFPH